MAERKVAGRYRLLEHIGEGGMGIVWRAHDELLDRVVAVKEVRYRGIDEAARTDLNRRTIREARTAGRLDADPPRPGRRGHRRHRLARQAQDPLAAGRTQI
ncbi:hypothetical protein AB0C32_45450, partial [Streptosporangium sp. NPDC048865]